jgi:hypothetical protein
VRQWLRSHLTFANVVSLAALFIALGGTATAVTYVVSSNSQVGPGTISGHKPPSGDHANIIANSINGADIADRSGVDTCQTPLLAKFGPICAGSDGTARQWLDAVSYCAGYGLRLPTPTEAIALAVKFDVPGVGASQNFWTDSTWINSQGHGTAFVVDEAGTNPTPADQASAFEQTVCVTDPSA